MRTIYLAIAGVVLLGTACSDQELHVAPQPQVPAIEWDPQLIDFGLMETGSELFQEITITSTGPVDLEITHFEMEGPENFVLIADQESYVMPPGEEITVVVHFTALGDGQDDAILHIWNTDPEIPDAQVEMHGAGLAPAILIDPAEWDFGDHGVGCEETADIYVKSIGTYPLTIHDFSFISSPSFTAMTLSTDELYAGMELAPGEEALVRVTFIPEDVVSYEGVLNVSSNDPEEPNSQGTQYGAGLVTRGSTTTTCRRATTGPTSSGWSTTRARWRTSRASSATTSCTSTASSTPQAWTTASPR